jgi:hypothetical protein
VAQAVECLPNKHKVLSSNPSTTKKTKRINKGGFKHLIRSIPIILSSHRVFIHGPAVQHSFQVTVNPGGRQERIKSLNWVYLMLQRDSPTLSNSSHSLSNFKISRREGEKRKT